MKRHLSLSRFRTLSAATLAVALMLPSASNADNSTSISFSKDGGSQVVSFPYTGSYSGPSLSEDWLTTGTQVKMSNGSGTLNITVSCDANSGAARSGYIEFYLSGSPYTIYVSQAGADDDRDSDVDDDPLSMPDLAFYTPDGWSAPVTLAATEEDTAAATTFTVGQMVHVNYCYKNQGTDSAPSGRRISAYLRDAYGENTIESWYVPTTSPLAAGDYKMRTNDNDFTTVLEPGDYSVLVVLDSTDVVSESDESNNSYLVYFTVVPRDTPDSKPDLVFATPSDWTESVFLSGSLESSSLESSFAVGSPIYLNFCYKNAGPGSAGAHVVDIAVYKSGDLLSLFSDSFSVSSLEATQGKRFSNCNLPSNLAEGSYSVTVWIDSSHDISESNEENNFKRIYFEVKNNSIPVPDISFGVDQVSTFTVPNAGTAVLVGASGVTWSNFSGSDSYGATTFVHENIVDCEKTAADDDDDYWCAQISDMNALFLTGWAQKTSYATVDALKGHFNGDLLRRWGAGAPVEGTYGFNKNDTWGDFFDWYKDETGIDLAARGALTEGAITASFPATLKSLMDNGAVVRMDVSFSPVLYNRKWKPFSSVSHGVVCVGYVANGNALNALLIVDPDNDQYTGDGGVNAPNSVMYCPVSWDGSRYTISGIWGQDGVVESRYRALAKMEGGNPPATTYKIAFNANGGKAKKKMKTLTMTFGSSKKLTKNAYTRNGYIFAGWAVSKADAKKGIIAYKNQATAANLTTTGGTVTLYAVWAKPTYKVRFYANGGKGSMSDESFTYGKSKKLSANKFTRKGYKFAGWARTKTNAKNGFPDYKNKAKVKNLVMNGKTVKLYAVWQPR